MFILTEQNNRQIKEADISGYLEVSLNKYTTNFNENGTLYFDKQIIPTHYCNESDTEDFYKSPDDPNNYFNLFDEFIPQIQCIDDKSILEFYGNDFEADW